MLIECQTAIPLFEGGESMRAIVTFTSTILVALAVLVVAAQGSGSVLVAPEVEHPPVATAWGLHLGGVEMGLFIKADGVASALAAVDPKGQGTRDATLVASYGPIILTRGASDDSTLWTRYAAGTDGTPEIADGTLTLFDQELQPIFRFSLDDAWLSSIAYSVESGGAIIERVTLNVKSFTRTP
jgi:hypothetical protein